ncbi:manganese transport protein MntH [Marinomonas spartinae]|uniref:Manganese transport protein MntH n=1 Tax=Marinomonas spartinae TaxID=1792290 RepID=A0A1A8TCD1_9GAMM|nr:hypothetical protein [Marinomonas spartinae]SBS29891.1 manganese transport protein MntH [Marinomonas spartinae]SBS37173.1 manganese transport protein MntH [Marinomonas spartinae]
MKIENRTPKDVLEPYHNSKNTANKYKILLLMGPAFVAGAWRFGPGALTSAVQAGSLYGYQLL